MATDIRTALEPTGAFDEAARKENFLDDLDYIKDSLKQVKQIIKGKEPYRELLRDKTENAAKETLALMIQYFDPHDDNPREVYGVDLLKLGYKTIKVLKAIDPYKAGLNQIYPKKEVQYHIARFETDIQYYIALLEKECEFIESGGTVEMRRMKDSKYPYIRESGQNWIDTVAVPPPVTPTPTLAYEI